MGKKNDGANPKSQQNQNTGAPAGPSKCPAEGCQKSEWKFGFCDTHYEHFKFGLIKKNGQPVSDYDKKFAHYQAWKDKQAGQQVA